MLQVDLECRTKLLRSMHRRRTEVIVRRTSADEISIMGRSMWNEARQELSIELELDCKLVLLADFDGDIRWQAGQFTVTLEAIL